MLRKRNYNAQLWRFIRFSHIDASNETVNIKTDILSCDQSVNAFVSLAESGLNSTKDFKDGALLGYKIAVKDNICTKSLPVTCSSAMLRTFTSPFDATVVTLLQQAGADIIGKTNCDEFGMGSFNVHSLHGPVINPHQSPFSSVSWEEREQRSAGGSSGGSAAAVATGLCDAALSTDTGGSTRLPASYCGIVGLKPSYGLISRWGVVAFADSLDCVGIMAKDVSKVASIFRILAVRDEKDPTSANARLRSNAIKESGKILESFRHNMNDSSTNLTGLIVGIPQEYFPSELDDSAIRKFRHVITSLKSQGAKVISVSLPMTRYALSTYYVIASAEASSNMARYTGVHFGTREELPENIDKTKASNVYAYGRSKNLGREVQKRILLGNYALTADAFDNYFLQAQRIRKLIHKDFDNVFDSPGRSQPGVHILLHLSAMRTAPLLSEVKSLPPIEAYVQDVLTVPASLSGLPAISIPAGLADDGWPVGVSVVGKWGHDNLVLRVGEIIQHLQSTKVHE